MSGRIVVVDDSSPDIGPRLEAWTDGQGDVYMRVISQGGVKSSTIRVCGPGGGSRHPGLATRLAAAFFPPDGKE